MGASPRALRALFLLAGFYLHGYATLGVPANLLPPRGEIFGGFRRLLAEPERQAELAAMRRELPEGEESPYDSHPPIAERVRIIEALPGDGRTADTELARPALQLLLEPERVLADLEHAVLTPEAVAMRRLDWPELVQQSLRARCAEGAEPLRRAVREERPAAAGTTDATAELMTLLTAIDDGRLWHIANRLPKTEEAARATGRAAREFARPAVRAGLSQLAVLALVDSGRARWELSWTESARLRLLPDGSDPGPDQESGSGANLNSASGTEAVAAALDPAVADTPDTAPLRALLAPAAPSSVPTGART